MAAGIKQLPTQLAGQVGVLPNQKFAVFYDNLATITTAGYLNQVDLQSNPIGTTDILQVLYSFNDVTQTGTYETFTVSISGAGVITLVQSSQAGEVTLPTIANHIATFTNTAGGISEDPATAISGGNIQAGLDATAGTLISYPSTTVSGKLIVAAVNNSSGNFNTTISNAAAIGQSQVISIPDSGATTANAIISKSAGTQNITSGALQVNAGAITSGLTTGGFVGLLKAFPTTTTSGFVALQAAVNGSGNFGATISNATTQAQATVYTLPDAGAATAGILVNGAALVSGNLVQASGTAGAVVDSGITAASVSSSITQLGQLQQISVTLNTAAVIAAYATPQVLIAAVAGKVAVVHSANVYTASTGNTAFATGVAPIIQYGTTVHGAGTIAVGAGFVTGDITAATSQVRTIGSAASAVYTGITNTAVTFSCTTAYTAGTGTSVTFTLVYEMITATV